MIGSFYFYHAKEVFKSTCHHLLHVWWVNWPSNLRGEILPLSLRNELYFGCKLGDKDKRWAPHFCCVTCVRLLTGWTSGSYWMPFTVPMVWREPTDLSSGCYFCFTNITGITSKSKHTVKYPDLPSAMRPVTHIGELPVPSFQKIWLLAVTALILMMTMDSKKGIMLMAIQHLQQVVPHLNHMYSHKDILMTLSRIWIC